MTPTIPQNTASQIEVISALWETQIPKINKAPETINHCTGKLDKHPNGQNQLKFVAHWIKDLLQNLLMITSFFLKLTWVTNEDDNATGSLMKSLWVNRKGA